MASDKDRTTTGKTKAKDVLAKLDASARFPVGSVTVDGRPIEGGGVVTAHLVLPTKHPTKDERRWPKHPHLEWLISQGVIAADDAPIMSDADAADPAWAGAQEDDPSL